MNYKPYKHLPPFKGMVLQNFPFIEEDFDAITNYQLLCKVVEYLNNVVANELTMEENVTNLYNSFVELKNYVDNYFDNLDVQEEINNKLDEMVEDGTLLNIITNYTSITKIYNTTVELLEDTNVIENQKVKTLGYYEINDGGGAEFIIDSENKPQMIIKDNTINILSLGARKYDNDTKYDIKEYIEKYLELNADNKYNLKLYIPSGIYHLSETTISEENGFYIYGDNSFMLSKSGSNTVITTLNDNQDFLLNIGDNTKFTSNWTLKNLTLSSAEYELYNDYYRFSSRKKINTYLTNFNNATFGKLDNLFYIHINGGAISIGSMWEVYSNIINFRDINAVNGSIIEFKKPDTLLLTTANQSALTFENFMFEKVLGHLINIGGGTKLGNTIINNINFEDYSPSDWDNITTTIINNDNRSVIDSDETLHQAIFNFEHTDGISTGPTGRLIINNILCNNMAVHYTTYNNNNYVYDRIVNNNGDYNYVGILINNIENIGMNKDIDILYSRGDTYQYSYFKLNNCNNPNGYDFRFNVEKFTYIECDSRIKAFSSSIKHYILNNTTPAYKLVNNRPTGERFLYSDINSLNNLNLVVSLKSAASIGFILNSYNLYIRAKIPNGETATLYIGGNHSQVLTLEGTGDYAIYDFEVGSQFPLGDIINLNFNSNNTATSCLIDYIIN